MSPLWTLAPVSLLLGAFLMWIFRRTTDRATLRETIRHIQAHLLEFWLFVDEPRLIGKSWKGLLLANLRLYRLLLAPLLILAALMTPLFFGLDAVYGSAPLAVGKPALITLGMGRPIELLPALPEFKAPQVIGIESPAVRVFSQRQVSWRIRPLVPLTGELRWSFDGKEIAKRVVAGQGLGYHARKRARSLIELVRYPVESPLPGGPVEWIEIDYPAATLRWF